MAFQVIIYIHPEGADIGQLLTIDQVFIYSLTGIDLFQAMYFHFFGQEIIFQHINALQALIELHVNKFERFDAEKYGALNPPGVLIDQDLRIAHFCRDQVVGRDRGYGIIKILDLGRKQVDLDDIPLQLIFGYIDPVPDFE
ncbi:hypothetical protein D9M68_483920 [compost metagenome]